MNRIIDYVFYRVYLEYEKYNHPATFSSILYISVSLEFLFLPIAVPLCYIMRGEDDTLPIICFLSYSVLILIFTSIRYLHNDKIINLRCDYSGSKLNNSIPTWAFWLVLPICVFGGVAGVILVAEHIIRPYGLTGIGYDFFVNLFGN